ncbi:MAG TPA: rifamycin-inactivating phosphotransferase [Acidimicrobiales bacterium]|nr:rifamycin-inactivating phosphotransferase [Acidimicrobiales bacterium]
MNANRYVLGFEQVDGTQTAIVGGKGAQLGELSRIDGVRVPAGFCVTTDAFERTVRPAPSLDEQIGRLARVRAGDRAAVRTTSAAIRATIEAIVMPDDVADAIVAGIARLGGDGATYAVRSSATAEDLPTASFAGQHDSYLNVAGMASVLSHVSQCWASLFTERAVTYRLKNGIDHGSVQMAVVVQRMVLPDAAGILFTADPVTSNRTIVSVEATFGLGEALVSGLVNADVYKVRDGEVVNKAVGKKQLAIHPTAAGGTHEEAIDPARQERPVLTDAQAVRLAQLGRRIEGHFGRPLDIEWCLVAEDFQFVQSRPITTVFPVPERDDTENHVYVSVGHQQMMTDPMKPLGLAMWMLTTAPAPMHAAGGRLFVDVTERLASPASRVALLDIMGRGDPLIRDALQTVLDRQDFVPPPAHGAPTLPPPGGPPSTIDTDADYVAGLIARARDSIGTLQRDIRTKTGPALFDFIRDDMPELRRILFDPQSQQAIMAGMESTWWLNDHMLEWLGEKNAADTLTESAPYNVTSEMGLALLDVADAIRPYRDVVALLHDVRDDDFLDGVALADLDGGPAARDAIRSYLHTYGMRCVGEIDITRPRWGEHPTALLPALLGNIERFEPGEAERRFERGKEEARQKELELLERLRALPEGEQKADETKRMIDRVRTFIGYREFPKYSMVNRYFIYKQAMLREADRLVQAQVLRDREDIFFLTLEELREVVRTDEVDSTLIQRRKDAFATYHSLTPPRVLTSDGEAVAGSYTRGDRPAGALIGLAVSSGTVEGRARVVLDMADADLDEGDILVTAYTDPSWSPLFVAIKGLVTEVGGLMTHGAVIAREYGLPAVVGVEHATELIEDGQRIRLNGTDGYIEVLETA